MILNIRFSFGRPPNTPPAALYIMDDDLDAAEAGLAQGYSTFHKVSAALFRPEKPEADMERRTLADKLCHGVV